MKQLPPTNRVRWRLANPGGNCLICGSNPKSCFWTAAKEDWLQAIKTGKRPCMDIEIGHRVATLNNLGNLSYVLARKLAWDGDMEQFVGDDDANRYLSRPQRHPYRF